MKIYLTQIPLKSYSTYLWYFKFRSLWILLKDTKVDYTGKKIEKIAMSSTAWVHEFNRSVRNLKSLVSQTDMRRIMEYNHSVTGESQSAIGSIREYLPILTFRFYLVQILFWNYFKSIIRFYRKHIDTEYSWSFTFWTVCIVASDWLIIEHHKRRDTSWQTFNLLNISNLTKISNGRKRTSHKVNRDNYVVRSITNTTPLPNVKQSWLQIVRFTSKDIEDSNLFNYVVAPHCGTLITTNWLRLTKKITIIELNRVLLKSPNEDFIYFNLWSVTNCLLQTAATCSPELNNFGLIEDLEML